MKNLLLIPFALLLGSCAINNTQHAKHYKGIAKGVITDMYANNVDGVTVVLDGKMNVNVWRSDLDSTFVIGNVKTLNVKWLTRKLKR